MTRYTYTISSGTVNGKVAPRKLTSEIRAAAIIYALEGVTLSGDNLLIDFKSSLSTQEEAVLTSVINSHDGLPSIDDIEKFTLVDFNGDPTALTIVGPQGPAGEVGPQGPQGPAGGLSELFYQESEEESSTTSATYQTKTNLSATVAGGDYILDWFYEVASSDKDLNVRVVLDGSTTLGETTTGNESLKNQFFPNCGFKKITLAAGTYQFSVQYNDSGGGTAKIRRSRLKLMRTT